MADPRGANVLLDIIFAENCIKMKKVWTDRGCVRIPRPTPDPVLAVSVINIGNLLIPQLALQ